MLWYIYICVNITIKEKKVQNKCVYYSHYVSIDARMM